MPDKRWKATERAVARLLGGARVPVSGRQRGDAPDVAHAWLSVEVKDREALPAWLVDALAQAEASAAPLQLPIAVLHQAGQRHDRALVVLRLGAFLEWFGDTGESVICRCRPARAQR